MVIIAIMYYPIHEFGHWLVAYVDGAEILGFYPFPWWENGFINACTIVNEWTFSSTHTLIFFLLAGFLITFLPSFLFFTYFYKKNQKSWVLPFTWVIQSPWASSNDFLNIGRVIQNPNLGAILYFGATIVSFLLIIWFIKNAKPVFRDLFLSE